MINKSTLRFLDIYLLIDLSEEATETLNHINNKLFEVFGIIQRHQAEPYCDSTIRFFNTRPEDQVNIEEHFGRFIWAPVSTKKRYANINHQLQLVYAKNYELKKTHYPANIDNSVVFIVTDKIHENLFFEADTFKTNKYLFYLGDLETNEITKLNNFTDNPKNIIYSSDSKLLVDLLVIYIKNTLENMTNILESSVFGVSIDTRIALLKKLIAFNGFDRGSTTKSKFTNLEKDQFELAFTEFLIDSETPKTFEDINDDLDLNSALKLFFKNNLKFNPEIKNTIEKTMIEQFEEIIKMKKSFNFLAAVKWDEI